MIESLVRVFVDAAPPQKLVLLVLAAAAAGALAVAAGRWRLARTAPPMLEAIQFGAPVLGVMTAALNGWHMMHSVLTEPVTLRVLAPGFMEMAVLVWAGALAGLVAVTLNTALDARRRVGAAA